VNETQIITVRYWAGAKHAAGTDRDLLETETSLTLSEIVARVTEIHAGDRLPQVLRACSALIGEQPVGKADPDHVRVEPGQTVEFLPPFAGG